MPYPSHPSVPKPEKTAKIEKYLAAGETLTVLAGPKTDETAGVSETVKIKDIRKNNSYIYVPDVTGGNNGKFYKNAQFRVTDNTSKLLTAEMEVAGPPSLYNKVAALGQSFTMAPYPDVRGGVFVAFIPQLGITGDTRIDPDFKVRGWNPQIIQVKPNTAYTCNAETFNYKVPTNFNLMPNSFCARIINSANDIIIFNYDRSQYTMTPSDEITPSYK